jgi:membrane protease YdiL (CAAX protease family)
MASWPWWVPWLVYGPMGALGAGWAFWTRGTVLSVSDGAWFRSTSLSVWCGAAVGVAVSVVLLTRELVHRTRWARQLHQSLRGALLGLSTSRIALLSLLSATAEELFFRAALAPSLGLLASAVLFGAAHISPAEPKLAWSLWALVMGLVFGLLFFASGSLLPPLLAHALINYENMHYICNYDPTPLDIDRRRPQDSRRESL